MFRIFGLPRNNARVSLHVVVRTDGRFDAALHFAHRLDLRVRHLGRNARGVRGFLQPRDHPRTTEDLYVVAEASAVGGFVVERGHVLTFEDAAEIDRGERVRLPGLVSVRDLGGLRER